MMKRPLRTALLALLGLLAAACARHTIIPDETLAMIFRDAFLSNAYISEERIPTDSLRIYEPIFARYGYTTDDVHYTIGNFSKRKSARLSDVVERAIDLLEAEGKVYNRRVAILDTIDNVARRRFTRTVYSDSLIRVTRIKDTARLRVRIPDTRPGEYRVSFDYLIDSLDENLAPRMRVWLVEADSSRKGESSSILRKSSRERVSRILQADSSARSLVLSLYGTREKFRRPDVTIYDLKVSYTPETAEAVDSLYIDQLGLKIFADEFFRAAMPADSL